MSKNRDSIGPPRALPQWRKNIILMIEQGAAAQAQEFFLSRNKNKKVVGFFDFKIVIESKVWAGRGRQK